MVTLNLASFTRDSEIGQCYDTNILHRIRCVIHSLSYFPYSNKSKNKNFQCGYIDLSFLILINSAHRVRCRVSCFQGEVTDH